MAGKLRIEEGGAIPTYCRSQQEAYMIRRTSKNFLLSCIGFFAFTGCVSFHVGTLPPPPPDAKLRVYVQPVSSAARKMGFGKSHDRFANIQYRLARVCLEETGIYQVVPEEDVATVIGGQTLSRSLLQNNDWALAKKIAKAVHAEYVMIVEREKFRAELATPAFAVTNILINTDTGKKFGVRYEVRRNMKADQKEQRAITGKTYREIFLSAKEDMLATALKKAEGIKPQETAPPAPVTRAPIGQPVQAAAPDRQTAAVEPQGEPEGDSSSKSGGAAPETDDRPAGRHRNKETEPAAIPDYVKVVREPAGVIEPGAATGKTRLVVYDFDAPEQYKPSALILTDALREEFFQLRRFTLVNRENLKQVLQEMALQQTGLIDEKDAIKTGKGLAANQVVTGRLSLLGKTIIMQAKRIDVETLETLGIASEKSFKGREEEIMDKLPAFARQLSGSTF